MAKNFLIVPFLILSDYRMQKITNSFRLKNITNNSFRLKNAKKTILSVFMLQQIEKKKEQEKKNKKKRKKRTRRTR